nr:FtsQ-type POTRA domain-containing protein [uncultured Bacillus sp.]
MENGKIVSIEDRIPKLKQQRKKRANRRLILLLLLFFLLIACIIYFQSPISQVKTINISGNRGYSVKEITESADISNDTNIWKVKGKVVEGKLKRLPEIKEADVQIRWFNTVSIQIEEYSRIAYISKGKFFLPVLENGTVLEDKKTSSLPLNAPVLYSFSEGEKLKVMIESLEKLPPEVLNSISEIHHTPKKTDAYHISLFMNDGNEVNATIKTFAEKMSHYPSILSQLGSDKKGIIDLEVGSYFKAYEQAEGDDLSGSEEDRQEE